jgi:uncharacterized RDD family membrane protein YckC
MNWYYADQGQQKGPIDEPALDQLVVAGVVQDDTLVWHEGMPAWQKHSSVRGPVPPPAFPSPSATTAGETRYCGECGRPFSANELVPIGAVSVCATCKPVYLQKLREGGGLGVGARRYGGFWIRFAARVVDGILLNVIFLVVRLPFGVAMFNPGLAREPAALAGFLSATIAVYFMSAVATACYEIFMISMRGATIGKMIFGLKVIRADGAPVSLGLSTGRYFAQWISAITFGIGYIMAGFDDQKRALHDRICETRVIYSR